MSLITRIRTVLTMGRGVAKGLPEFNESRDPFELFDEWFGVAKESGILLPETMTLGTADKNAVPSMRQVLLKNFGEGGFCFYTNYDSRKAKELEENPRASLLFHWAIFERQIRIEGTVTRLETSESEAYFKTRARGSQLGAWASAQSSKLRHREDLARKFQEIEAKFQSRDIPLPPNWGGYRLRPDRFEFWQGRLNRLHDRLVFELVDGRWKPHRLFP